MANPKTPTCPACGHKFPGDPCKFCAKPLWEAESEKQLKLKEDRKARQKRGHGRQNAVSGRVSIRRPRKRPAV